MLAGISQSVIYDSELRNETTLAVKRERCKRSLHYFLTTFWDTIVEDEFIDNWHIPEVAKELEKVFYRVLKKKRKKDLVVNIPPGTTKSKLFSVMFPIWVWVNAPWMNFITSSHGKSLSLELADLSRDVMNSEKFREYFPDIKIRQGRDTKSKYQIVYKDPSNPIVTKLGGFRLATSSGSVPTGFHAHIIIIDDPIDPQSAESTNAEVRKSINTWIDRTLSTRKVDKKVTPTVLVMQRLHQDDPSGHLLSKGIPIVHINLPGELVPGDKDINVKPERLEKFYKNGFLDPRRLDQAVLADMLSWLGQYGFAGQVLQCPAPPGGGMFKPDNLKIISEMDWTQVRRTVWYWDKAGTEGGGAYSVGVRMAEMKDSYTGPKYIIIKIVRGQWASDVREAVIEQEAKLTGTKVIHYVEQEPGSSGKESAEGTIRRLATHGIKCKADRPTGDKIYRADPFSVQVNAGNVGIMTGDWVEPYKGEIRFFPSSKYKDQVDSSAGAYNKLFVVKKAGGWSKGRRH